MSPALATVAAAGIAAIASIIVAWLTLRQNSKINATHATLTVNSHKSADPTVLDRIDMLSHQVSDLTTRVTRIEEKIE